MCEHKFFELIADKPQWVCQQCGSTLSAINTTKLAEAEQQLAAANEKLVDLKFNLEQANARVAELERERNNYLSFGQGGASFTDSQWLDKLATTEQRAEVAEARIIGLEKELSDCKNMEDVAYQLRESLREEISSANARVAELEEFRSDVLSNIGGAITAEHVTEHLTKLRTVIFDERKAKEQAEARCAEIATAYQNMKGDFEHWAYCELLDSPPGKKCTCGVWEMVSAIENADAGTAILADNKRMREALEFLADYELCHDYSVCDAMDIAKAALEGNP